jgi:hypothetical protein
MAEFCPHCGEIGGLVRKEQTLFCARCGKQAGVIAPVERQVVNEVDERIRQGTAARCSVCQQLVELRGDALARHWSPGVARKLCPGSGKPLTAATGTAPGKAGKDLSASMTRDTIRLVSCRKGAAPQIEELTLAYLDKRDRVRVQIDALRDILGPKFQLCDYPAALGRPHLAIWIAPETAMCVVGKRHEQGGYQSMTETEIAEIMTDLQQYACLFFG